MVALSESVGFVNHDVDVAIAKFPLLRAGNRAVPPALARSTGHPNTHSQNFLVESYVSSLST